VVHLEVKDQMVLKQKEKNKVEDQVDKDLANLQTIHY